MRMKSNVDLPVFLTAAVALMFFACTNVSVRAAEFPNKPLRYIVPFPPGGATDIVARIIALAKSRPGELNYASAGVGTSPQLSMELFKKAADINIVHVSYRGAGPAVVDLMGGQVHSMFSTVPSLLGAIRGGAIRALAVTSTTRASDLPDVPTVAESGMPGFEVISWQGLCTPSGVPKTVLARLQAALAQALELPDTRKQIAAQGIQLTPLIADKFGAFIRGERAKWAKLVKELGIPPR